MVLGEETMERFLASLSNELFKLRKREKISGVSDHRRGDLRGQRPAGSDCQLHHRRGRVREAILGADVLNLPLSC